MGLDDPGMRPRAQLFALASWAFDRVDSGYPASVRMECAARFMRAEESPSDAGTLWPDASGVRPLLPFGDRFAFTVMCFGAPAQANANPSVTVFPAAATAETRSNGLVQPDRMRPNR
jgi:hypothetical protein